jgi:hypothetical protein
MGQISPFDKSASGPIGLRFVRTGSWDHVVKLTPLLPLSGVEAARAGLAAIQQAVGGG